MYRVCGVLWSDVKEGVRGVWVCHPDGRAGNLTSIVVYKHRERRDGVNNERRSCGVPRELRPGELGAWRFRGLTNSGLNESGGLYQQMPLKLPRQCVPKCSITASAKEVARRRLPTKALKKASLKL